MTQTTEVLFADDSATVRYMVKDYLESEGFTTLEGTNGREALKLFKDSEPDLVLLDLQMPEMDGFSVCSAIKDESDVPVIILTSMDEESDKEWAEDQGADSYLTKPVDKKELISEIQQFVST